MLQEQLIFWRILDWGGVNKIIFASTNAIYENEKNFPMTETINELPTLIYPNTKYCAERLCQSYVDTYGMNISCLRFSNVYGPHIDCLRKQPPFVGYMIRELFYDRVPTFHSDGNQRRDYIFIDDLIDLALKVRTSSGFECVNCCSNKSYSVNEMYKIASEIMNKNITPVYADDRNYWKKYPKLYEGHYTIKDEILADEINKYSLCSYEYAKEKYNWQPKIDIYEGLKRVIEYTCEMLKTLNVE